MNMENNAYEWVPFDPHPHRFFSKCGDEVMHQVGIQSDIRATWNPFSEHLFRVGKNLPGIRPGALAILYRWHFDAVLQKGGPTASAGVLVFAPVKEWRHVAGELVPLEGTKPASERIEILVAPDLPDVDWEEVLKNPRHA